MSNILTPIVARYSVFFTLTMFSSSKISRTRQPTHVVQGLILAAEQRYKDRTTLKMRALIRSVSTSTSSSSSSSSSNTRTSTSITTATSDSEPPPSPSKCVLSFPPSVRAEAGSSSSLPPATASVSRPGTQCDPLSQSHVFTTQIHTPSPPLTHAHSSLDPDIGQLSTHAEHDAFAAITATSHDYSHTPTYFHAADVEVEAPTLSTVKGLPKSNIHPIRSASKVSKTSIATLLSVTLTMILLSLLQGKKRHFRRQRRSLKRNISRHHSKHYLAHSSSLQQQQQHTMHLDSKSCTSLTQSLQDEEMRTYTIAAECHTDQEPAALYSDFGPTRSSQSSSVDTVILEMPSGPYGGTKGIWSLSESHLPERKRSKQGFVDAWLEEQRHGMDEHMQGYPGRISPSWTGSEESLHVEEEELQSLNPVHDILDHHQYIHTHIRHGDINRGAHDQYEPPRPNEIYQSSLLPNPNHRHQHLNLHRHPRPPPQHHSHYHPNHLHPNYLTQKVDPKGNQLGYYYQSQPQPHGCRPQVFLYPQGNITTADNPRRSLSLTRSPSPRHSPPLPPVPASSRYEHLTPAEKARHEYKMRRERHQIQHQKHRQQQIQQQYQGYPVPRHPAFLPNDAHSTQYPSRRSAHDLAWERHLFYQQQQHQEEIIAERRRKEAMRFRDQLWQQQGPVQEQDLVARTSSLNRITSSSLSPKTAQELGLSRSKTMSAHGEQKRVNVVKRAESSATSKPNKGRTFIHADLNSSPHPSSSPSPRPSTPKETAKSILADCPVFSVGKRLMRKSDSKVNLSQTNDKDQPSSNETTSSSLTRKKTLKDLGPSLKSLARRYSSRLRPNSYAGSNSDPVIQFPEGKAIKSHSLTTRTSYSSTSKPVTLSDNVVDLEQLQQSVQYLTPTDRVPIHRRVTLYRPEMTTPSTSATDDSNDNQTRSTDPSLSRTRSLCSSLNKRESLTLRFANGRGLDLTMFEPPKPAVATEEKEVQPAAALDGALSIISSSLPTGTTAPTKTSDPKDEQEWTRRQVVAILAMGRKERVSAKSGQSLPHVSPGLSKAPLSPLALEAQEDPPQAASVQPDPCETISFMLVPKSRYEFQPLVAV